MLGRLAVPVLALLALVCCAGRLLIVALATAGAGAWLAAHGFALAGAVLMALAVVVAWRKASKPRPAGPDGRGRNYRGTRF